MKSKQEILDETLKHYYNHPERRAVDSDGMCVILDDKGHTCAFGRCMTPEAQERFWNNAGPEFIGTSQFLLDSYLRPEYQGHSGKFWFWIQKIHDRMGGLYFESTLKRICKEFNLAANI